MDKRVAISYEEQEERKIQATRKRHAELKERLLNPNQRITGRDEQALNTQIMEKQNRLRQEKEEDREYAMYLRETTFKMKEMEINNKEANRQRHIERQQEWQIAAEEKRKRDAEDIPSNHIEFDGEDSNSDYRKALQQAQMRKWVEKQGEDRRRKVEDETRQEMEHATCVKALVNMQNKMMHENEVEKMQLKKRIQAENQQQAQLKLERRAVDEKYSRGEPCALLSDTNESETSMLGSHRYRPDHYRGLNNEGQRRFKDEQLKQIEDRQERLREQALEDRRWAEQQESLVHIANHISYNEQDRRARNEMECKKEQLRQMDEKKTREKKSSSNAFEDSFFENFGRSHR